MIKVITVDDEYLAREGMKRAVPWKDFGCELCYECEDGFSGIQAAKRIMPDIIITDINMPGMSGLEMAEKIKEFLPNCRFIIITGYEDFEFARKALKLNAYDFILKPIDNEELFDSIRRAVFDCNKEKEYNNISYERVLLNMMRGKELEENFSDEKFSLNHIGFKKLIIICIEVDNYHELIEEDKTEILHSETKEIKVLSDKFINDIHYFIECHDDLFALVLDADKYTLSKDCYSLLDKIQSQFKYKYNATLSMGVSTINSCDNIKIAYTQGKEALKDRLYKGKGSLNFFEDQKKESQYNYKYIFNEEKELMLKIMAGDTASVQKSLKFLYFNLFIEKKYEVNFVKEISIEIILRALNLLNDYNIPYEKVACNNFNIYNCLDKLNTIIEIYSKVSEVIFNILREIKIIRIEASETGIENAIDYINKHFCEEICLSDVSKEVFLSESYLSRKIKKILGISFVEYVTKLRIEKAMEYLKEGSLKITDISSKIGYSDYRYFTSIFKKYTGYSPSEYIRIKFD